MATPPEVARITVKTILGRDSPSTTLRSLISFCASCSVTRRSDPSPWSDPDTIRPALQIVRIREGLNRVCGCYVLITRKGEIFFLADTSVNIEPTAEALVEIALYTAPMARRFDIVPRVAMLCLSSFGSVDHPVAFKARKAVELTKVADPTLNVDGEIMADEALSPELIEEHYPFSQQEGGANVLILPDLASANITTKLLGKIGGGESIGPIFVGMSRPVYVLQRTATVDENRQRRRPRRGRCSGKRRRCPPESSCIG